jgi:hypothetical protein
MSSFLVIGPILSLHRINGAVAVVGAESLLEQTQMQAIRLEKCRKTRESRASVRAKCRPHLRLRDVRNPAPMASTKRDNAGFQPQPADGDARIVRDSLRDPCQRLRPCGCRRRVSAPHEPAPQAGVQHRAAPVRSCRVPPQTPLCYHSGRRQNV